MNMPTLLRRGSAQREVTGHKIFVIGSGRSGTHWVGYILEGHPDIHVTIEKPPIFDWVTDIALDASKKEKLFPKLTRLYQKEHAAVSPKHYADKSHPNIWIAEDLAEAFPEARFVGIQRNPYATVASMLKHTGVLTWHKRWKEFPIPNRFLGITNENRAAYGDMPLAAKCALRWKVHKERLERLRETMGPTLLVLKYEDVILEPETQLDALNRFLALPSPIPRPNIKSESLDRWKTELSDEVKQQVEGVTGIPADAC
jgi:hypothetical protein